LWARDHDARDHIAPFVLPQEGRLLSQRCVGQPIVHVERCDKLTQGHAPSPIPHRVDARICAEEYVLERARHRTHSVLHKRWLLGERHQAEQKNLEFSQGYVLVHEVLHRRIKPGRPSIRIPVDGGNQERHLRWLRDRHVADKGWNGLVKVRRVDGDSPPRPTA